MVTSDNGTQVGSIKYYPYGSTRSGSVPTDKKFTGQRLDGTGLYYYNARYYDAGIGRFISADTIVPDSTNPQFLNCYSYVLNNPLRYTDPYGSYVVVHPGPNAGALIQAMTLLEIVAPEEYDRLVSLAAGEVTLEWSQDDNSWTETISPDERKISISRIVKRDYGPKEAVAEIAHEAVHLDKSLRGNSVFEEMKADQRRREVAESLKGIDPEYLAYLPDYSNIDLRLTSKESLQIQLERIRDDWGSKWGIGSGRQPSKADIVYSCLPLFPPSNFWSEGWNNYWTSMNLQVSGY